MDSCFKTPTTSVVSLTKIDPTFYFSHDGITITPRASIVVTEDCPRHIKDQILYYFQRGYISALANMTEQELLMSSLTK
jgi:hypothetical protein